MTGPAPAPSAVSAVSERGEVHLGQPFKVVVELRHHPSQRYALGASQDPGPFALLGGGCATRAGALDGETRCEVELALLDLGAHSPTLRLDASPEGAGRLEVTATAVKAVPVTDLSTPAHELALRGMPEPVPLFVPTWEPLAWIALGVLVALSFAVAGVRRLVARLREAEERRRAAPPPPPTPSEALQQRLDALGAAPLSSAEAGAWFELSRAIRAYVAALSPAATLDRTTGEVLAALRAAPIGGLDLGWFAAFAAELDRAKYAGIAPDAESWGRALAAARALLEATRPPRWHPDEEARRA